MTTVPTPAPVRRFDVPPVAGWTGALYAGGGVAAGLPHAGRAPDGGSVGAGCCQRSPCGCVPGAAHAQRASGRGSGVGA